MNRLIDPLLHISTPLTSANPPLFFNNKYADLTL